MTARTFMVRLLVMALVVLPAALGLARVSRGIPLGGDLFDPATFGRVVYRTVMWINGGRADVAVTTCDRGTASVKTAFGGESAGAAYREGTSMGLGRATRDGRSVRVMTIEPPGAANPLMVSVIQSDADERQSRSTPSHGLDDVPALPDADVEGLLRSDDTRTAVERLTTRRAPEGVLAFYDGAMTRGGWTRLSGAPDASLRIYVKDTDVCCVGARAVESDGETRVTLLHKRGAVN